MPLSEADMQRRLVRYSDLRPCTTAFVDARTPGSERKENFTIIGPGVAENPDQHVHINIPHGFNVGGARQPPRCVNSQHSHETAEVFVIHSGLWRFKTGETGEDGFVDLAPGDTISIPTQVFRGFENIGETTGFMFAILGGDDPGRVTWAPYVFEAARTHGLVLLENGRLIDTHREAIPAGARPMIPTTKADVARMRQCGSAQLSECIVRFSELTAPRGANVSPGFQEFPIIGGANAAEYMPAGRLGWPHGFQLRALRVAVDAQSPNYWRGEEEVLFIHQGSLLLRWGGGALQLGEGDTLTVPKLLPRTLQNPFEREAVAFIIRGTDQPQPPQRSPN
jgi:mannose-6-phosphate isomerase-like protein (cupin superfamily)